MPKIQPLHPTDTPIVCVRLAILCAPDALVTLRSLRHAHAMMRELLVREGGLADRDDLARKS
eukprot:1608981-Prymnesium_polylepis.1